MEIKKLTKKKFYSSREAILLDSVDLSKIVVSSRWKLNVIKPLCIILPQMNGYIKYFDDGGRICHLLQMMKKFMRNIMKYGM